MRRRIALCLALAVVLAGCTRPSLTPRQYRIKANAICAEAQRQQAALGVPASNGQVVPLLRRLRAIGRRETARIAALDPPLGREGQHDRAVELGIAEDRATGRLTAALRKSADPLRDLKRSARALRQRAQRDAARLSGLNLRTCANRRRAPIAP